MRFSGPKINMSKLYLDFQDEINIREDENYGDEELVIKSIDNTYLDKEVKVTGELTSIQQNNQTAILNIEQYEPKQLTIFLFKDKEIHLQKGETITVSGEVKEYANEYELIADKIEVDS